MRQAPWLVGFALSCLSVSVALAVDTIPRRDPTPGPHEQRLHRPVLRNPPAPAASMVQHASPVRQAPRGKTREEVKRELAAARAAGCMDVPDNQYPQPCPPAATVRSTVDAFQINEYAVREAVCWPRRACASNAVNAAG